MSLYKSYTNVATLSLSPSDALLPQEVPLGSISFKRKVALGRRSNSGSSPLRWREERERERKKEEEGRENGKCERKEDEEEEGGRGKERKERAAV